jgi:hypothetical protein
MCKALRSIPLKKERNKKRKECQCPLPATRSSPFEKPPEPQVVSSFLCLLWLLSLPEHPPLPPAYFLPTAPTSQGRPPSPAQAQTSQGKSHLLKDADDKCRCP